MLSKVFLHLLAAAAVALGFAMGPALAQISNTGGAGPEIRPIYPPEARRLGQQGVVVVRLRVLATGEVKDVSVQTSSGFPLLDQAAVDAARITRVLPGTRGGQPVEMWMNLPIRFVLEDARSSPPQTYAERVRAAIKPNIHIAEHPPGNIVAEVEIQTDPTGLITSSRLTSPSGHAGWDEAVLNAVTKTQRLPLDVDGRVPDRLVVSFVPGERPANRVSPAPPSPAFGAVGTRTLEISRLMEALVEQALSEPSYAQLFAACTQAQVPAVLAARPKDRTQALMANYTHVNDLKLAAGEPLDTWTRECADRMLRSLAPRNRHYDAQQYEEFRTAGAPGVGFGLVQHGGQWLVRDTAPGAPAAAAGLAPGDTLFSFDGHLLEGKSADDLSALLSASHAASVQLTWLSVRQGGRRMTSLVRREIVFSDADMVINRMDDHLYIRLPQMREDLPRLLVQVLRAERLPAGVPKVLDLRGNSGGLLHVVYWLGAALGQHGGIAPWTPALMRPPRGPFVATDALANGRLLFDRVPAPTEQELQSWASGRWIVLVDEQTASGATWLAGVLQELNGALLVGAGPQQESNLEIVQRISRNDLLYAARFEIGKLALPSGRIVNRENGAPDRVLPIPPRDWTAYPRQTVDWRNDPMLPAVTGLLRAGPPDSARRLVRQ